MRALSALAKEYIQMKTIAKFGLAALASGAFLGTALPSKADTPDPSNPFTKHGLPVPGVYFKAKENQQATTIAVSKTGQGLEKENSQSLRSRRSGHPRIHRYRSLRGFFTGPDGNPGDGPRSIDGQRLLT